MKVLITLNFVVALLLAISFVAFQKYELALWVGVPLLLGFWALAALNLASVFVFWRRHRFRALVPFGTFIAAAVGSVLVTDLGTSIVSRGTPSRPDSFFDDQTKAELTQTAKQLLGYGFKRILTYPDKPAEIHMLAGHQTKDVDPRILATLRKYRFIRTDVDDCQGIVTFGHYHLRRWDDYIWAKNGLTEPTSMPSTITESDIEDWTDLRRAGTNQGISRHLNITVGPDILDRLQTGANSDVVEETRSTVLTALNQQRLAASRLVEVPEITYEEWRGYFQKETGLHIDGIYISDSFWEGRLLKQLLSEGVLTLATDGRHLKIKPDLTDKQRLQTEWLHVGIMNHAYGNLLAKRQYQFQKELGDNWYFNQS